MIVCCVTYEPDLSRLEEVLGSLNSPILIVDNGSTTSVTEFLKTLGAQVVFLGKNVGIGQATNIAIKHAKSMGYQHCCLLDQDSVLGDQYLIAAESLFSSLPPETFAVAPFSENKFDVTNQVTNTLYFARSLLQSGAVINLKHTAIIGPQLEDWFIDLVDLEWFYRATSLGFKLYASEVLKIEHQLGDSMLNFFGRKVAVHNPKRIYFRAKNTVRVQCKRHVPVSVKINLIKKIVSLVAIYEIKNIDKRFRYVRALMAGFRDGLL
jgi:rhamnosyltransferase